jgi:hypothetical protein
MKLLFLWIFALHACTARATTEVMYQGSLTEFKWQNRLIIIQVNSKKELSQLQDEIYYHSSDFNACKLLMLISMNDKTWILDATTAQTVSPQLNHQVLKTINQNLEKVLLIGLDGGIKNRYTAKTFSLEQVFNDIDLMPMRRLEIQRKFNG